MALVSLFKSHNMLTWYWNLLAASHIVLSSSQNSLLTQIVTGALQSCSKSFHALNAFPESCSEGDQCDVVLPDSCF